MFGTFRDFLIEKKGDIVLKDLEDFSALLGFVKIALRECLVPFVIFIEKKRGFLLKDLEDY